MKSSTTANAWNRRPLASASDTKSNDQRWFAASGNAIGDRVPIARLRPPPFTHSELLLTVEPKQPLMVQPDALTRQENVQSPVTEPPSLTGQHASLARISPSPGRLKAYR